MMSVGAVNGVGGGLKIERDETTGAATGRIIHTKKPRDVVALRVGLPSRTTKARRANSPASYGLGLPLDRVPPVGPRSEATLGLGLGCGRELLQKRMTWFSLGLPSWPPTHVLNTETARRSLQDDGRRLHCNGTNTFPMTNTFPEDCFILEYQVCSLSMTTERDRLFY